MEYSKCIYKFLCFQDTFNIFHYEPLWSKLCNNFSKSHSKISSSIILVTFSCRREILTRRTSDNHIWVVWTYLMNGSLNIHQVSVDCRMIKIIAINVECILPVIESSNNIHACFLKTKT